MIFLKSSKHSVWDIRSNIINVFSNIKLAVILKKNQKENKMEKILNNKIKLKQKI